MLRNAIIFIILMICIAASCTADEQGWQWPEKLTIAGFNITDISGTTRPDGSGSAKGTVSLGLLGDQSISLSRSSNEEVTGSISLNTDSAGADIQAKLTLDENGLSGRGTVKSSPKPIADASMNVARGGAISGSGRVSLGSLSVPVDFEIGGSFEVNGSMGASKRVDTPLALYEFNGSLDIRGDSGKILVYANGDVKRTGKVADQTSTESVSNAQVNPSDGQATINVGGVNVTFKFF
ncbi:hypothetical protein LLG46_11175 [bacterium]|nr:hypothetical protein [bacterium]